MGFTCEVSNGMRSSLMYIADSSVSFLKANEPMHLCFDTSGVLGLVASAAKMTLMYSSLLDQGFRSQVFTMIVAQVVITRCYDT
jgi:hypothetical protein